MKMVKSLFLGSAAGLVAVAGAQAADLPVKAKPVEYVKVCSLYGAGFYYLPGTDICVKIGGYVRYQHTWGMNGGTYAYGDVGYGTHGRQDDEHHFMRARTVISMDTRQQTAYGTLRTYMNHGWSHDVGGVVSGLYSRRAFIQIAGFTFGRATSYFDFFNTAAVAYNAGSIYTPSTGDGGWTGAWYTAQLGNGVSATVGMEYPLRRGTWDNSGTLPLAFTGAITYNNKATQMPDWVANLAINQAWGAAQISVVVGDSSAGYYGGALETAGHPGDKLGWAVNGGIRLNTPMVAPGNYFQAQVTYSEGLAARAANNVSQAINFSGSNTVGFGHMFEGVHGTSPGAIELTKFWSAAASYEHNWNAQFKTSIYGSYLNVDYNANATALLCAQTIYGAGCNPDWSLWAVGSRTQWSPVRGFYMGVDVMYNHINSASTATGTTTTPALINKPAGIYTIADQGVWHGSFRVHRDILP